MFTHADPKIEIGFEGNLFDPESVVRLRINEAASVPSSFEIHLADPQFELWSKADAVCGTTVTIHLDDADDFCGIVYGRRIVTDPSAGGSILVLWGFDPSRRLQGPKRCRSFGPSSALDVAEQITSEAGLAFKKPDKVPGRLGTEDSQIVQYEESDFAHLRRLACLCGLELWPWRGSLWFDHGADATHDPLMLELSQLDADVGGFVCEENWLDICAAHVFPRGGAPFKNSPPLDEADDGQALPQTRPDGMVRERLVGNTNQIWPTGLAASPSDQQDLAKYAIEQELNVRFAGAITLTGPPVEGLRPGRLVEVKINDATIFAKARVMGVETVVDRGARQTTLQFGRAAISEQPNLRPAVHLWPAKVLGRFDKLHGTVEVGPIGWDQDSKPLIARILSAFATKDGGAIHCPPQESLVLVGFESGNPDTPVVLGALHDSESPDVKEGQLAWILKSPFGGDLTAELTSEGLTVKVAKLPVTIMCDAKVVVSKLESLDVTSQGEVSISGSAMTFQAGKIDLKKK